MNFEMMTQSLLKVGLSSGPISHANLTRRYSANVHVLSKIMIHRNVQGIKWVGTCAQENTDVGQIQNIFYHGTCQYLLL